MCTNTRGGRNAYAECYCSAINDVHLGCSLCVDAHLKHFKLIKASNLCPKKTEDHYCPSFHASIAPDDVSLKVWRAEACMGLRRFSDALRDLDDLCCVRPNWTEVRAFFADCTG